MRRREFNHAMAALAAGAAMARPAAAKDAAGGITDVQGIRVGHFTDSRRPTGCTVLIFDKSATAGVDVRGSAPGTRETDLLSPTNTVQQVQAILLSGGSAFGLDAAGGVVRYLEANGIGLHVGSNTVPIVPAAVIYDLAVGDPKIRPAAESGYQACKAATSGPVAQGNIGAGAGATVGKMFGMKFAMKSGIGTASIHVAGTGIIVSAIVAVNAVGDIIDPKTGKIIAGARKPDGSGFLDSMAQLREGREVELPIGANSTIGVVATNVAFEKVQLTKIAQMAHDGFARTINPTHTLADGDTIFAVATGAIPAKANHGAIGALAADVMAEAVLRAVRSAQSLPGLPAWEDVSGGRRSGRV